MQNKYSKTWQEKTLGDICEINYGTRVVKKRDGGTIYPVYGGGGATFFMDTYNRENSLVVARFAMSEQCTRFVKDKFFLNDSGLTLKPIDKNEISQDFLNWQMLYLNDYIYSLGRGSAQKNLNIDEFKKTIIKYTNLEEQERIVGILDKVFENIEQAKKNAEQNLQNAKNLFDSELENIFTGNIEDWEKLNVGEIIKLEYGKALPYSDRCNNGENPVYGANGIKDRTNKYLHDKPSIIVGRKGSVGELNYVESKFWALDVTYYVKFDENQYNLNFLYYLLKRLKLQTLARGVKPGLNRNEVYNLNVAIPKINTQQQIVEKLDKLQEQVKSLEAIYEQKIKDLEELKQSILQKAFNGEL